jgi:hypothetical protein
MAVLTPRLNEITSVKYKVGSNTNYPNIVYFGTACSWAKTCTIIVPKLPAGVSSVTVKRTATKATLGTIGTLGTQTSSTSAKTFYVYWGDTITISASATSGYNSPSVSPSSISYVNSDSYNITVSAGSAKNISFTIDKISCTATQGSTWSQWAAVTSGATVEYDYVLYSSSGSPICTLGSTQTSYSYVSPSSTITSGGEYYTVGGLFDYNIGGSGGSTDPGGSTPSNPGTGGGNNITFTMDGVSFTCTSGTKWSTLSSSVLGYGIYEDSSNGWATPVGSGGPPWVIDSAGDPVEYTATIQSGGSYHMGTPSS